MEHEPHILVVDDARDIREPLGQYLKKNGHRVTLAAAAAAALANVAIDLVVLDVMIPARTASRCAAFCADGTATGDPPHRDGGRCGPHRPT